MYGYMKCSWIDRNRETIADRQKVTGRHRQTETERQRHRDRDREAETERRR